MTKQEIHSRLHGPEAHDALHSLYGREAFPAQVKRLEATLRRLNQAHPVDETVVLRAPGRTELGGNHTDHNHGRVLAGAVSLDIAAAAVKTPERRVTLCSPAYRKPIVIDLGDTRKKKSEEHTTAGLVRGVAHYLGVPGGFYAEIDSSVPGGSGLSSSAAFEVLIGGVFNELYGLGRSPVELAVIGQRAENAYYGKPCGLMDQLASACGGVVAVDFKNPADPVITRIDFDPEAAGYALFVVSTGGDHANLTAAYGAIPAEMKAVAGYFGKKVLRDAERKNLMKKIPVLRDKTGDRSILRAIHFFQENERVIAQTAALQKGKTDEFLALVKASRDSSWEQLQNCLRPEAPRRQGIALALSLSDAFLEGAGASRVHGGGFEGTIQCYVPAARAEAYRKYMESVFGKGSVIRLRLCPQGVVRIL